MLRGVKQKTWFAKKGEVERKWWIVDVKGKILGRAATRIATLLMGKHKPTWTPHVDTGDFVVVVNADKVTVSKDAKKLKKRYYYHSGYAGGLKEKTLKEMMEKYPEKLMWLAVKRMLPKNRLGRKMIKKLKIYRGEEHPHAAQKPVEYKWED